MKKSLKIFFILITSLPALGMELEPNLLSLENMPQKIQHEIAQYLPFKGVESDTKLKKVLKKRCGEKHFSVEMSQSLKKIFGSPSIDNFKISPNGRFIIALEKDAPRRGFYVTDLKTKEKKFIPMPKGFDHSKVIAKNHTQKVVDFVNKGYLVVYRNYIHQLEVLRKSIEKIAISNDEEIAFSDSAGIYLLTENNTKVIPLQKFDIKHVTDIQSAFQQDRSNKIEILEFNQQGTKAGFLDKSGQAKLIALPDKKEPKKTLQKYFRENLIKNKLEW